MNDGDFEERWGDEDPIEEDSHIQDFEQSAPKRIRLEEPALELDDETKAAIERERDLKERDEFAERLKRREAENTKKLVEDRSSTKEGLALAQRRALADDAAKRAEAMPDLRLRSRQDYLKKREEVQLALLRKQVAEEAQELRTDPSALSRR